MSRQTKEEEKKAASAIANNVEIVGDAITNTNNVETEKQDNINLETTQTQEAKGKDNTPAPKITGEDRVTGFEYEYGFDLIKDKKTVKQVTVKVIAANEDSAIGQATDKIVKENPDYTIRYNGNFKKSQVKKSGE